MANKKPVFFVHDGGVDDYLSTVLLMTMEHVRVLGIAVTPADCYIEPAVSATRKKTAIAATLGAEAKNAVTGVGAPS